MHTRHNPISVPLNPNNSQGIEVKPGAAWLVTAGIIGRDTDGRTAVGIEAQADLAWRNLLAVLREAGMGSEDIVYYTSYLVRREDSAAYDKARMKYLGNARPASVKVYVAGLAQPDLLCEIQAFAAKAG